MANETQAVVTAKYLRILQRFTSREEPRYYLNGILFEPCDEGALLVATDGRRMGIIHDREAEVAEKGIWPLPAHVWKFFKAYQDLGKVRFDGRMASFERAGEPIFAVKSERINGEFPDWRAVIPRELPAGPVGTFNARYLADFSAEESANQVQVYCDATNPAVVLYPYVPEFFGLLMPIGKEGAVEPKTALPAWIQAEIAEKADGAPAGL